MSLVKRNCSVSSQCSLVLPCLTTLARTSKQDVTGIPALFSNLGANVLVCHHHFTFNSNTFLGFSLLACLFRSHNRIRPFFSPIHAFHLLSIHSLHWLDSNTRSGRRGKHSYLAPSFRETVFSISFFFSWYTIVTDIFVTCRKSLSILVCYEVLSLTGIRF